MSVEENKALMRRFYDEIVNEGRADLIEQLVSKDFVEREEFPGLGTDRAGLRDFLGMMRNAFPDFRMEVEDLIGEGDRVVARLTMSGTHKGEFMGMPPSGHSFKVETIDIVRFANGQAVEHWGVTDSGAMMEQLGAVPSA